MPAVTVDSSICQQGELNAHIVHLPEGIQNLEMFIGKAVFFADQQNPRQIFVDDGIWGASEWFPESFWGPVFVRNGGEMDPRKREGFRFREM